MGGQAWAKICAIELAEGGENWGKRVAKFSTAGRRKHAPEAVLQPRQEISGHLPHTPESCEVSSGILLHKAAQILGTAQPGSNA